MGQGINGGYPGAPGLAMLVEADRASDDSSMAQHVDDIAGDRRPIRWGVHTIGRGGALYIRWNGAGGYGDPLERDPERVRDDVASGTVSIAAEHDIYGVALDDRGGMDETATGRRRARLRERRMAGAAGARP